MGKIKNLIAAMLCIAIVGNMSAQDNFYAVKLGTFVSPQHSDFEMIHHVGFVYADPKAFNHEVISLGDFSTHAKAVESMLKVRKSGFPDATVQLLPLPKKERQVPVVQIATIAATGPKNWASYFNAYSKIYARQLDNNLVIYAGGFDNIEGAKAVLPFIKSAGFKGAFAQMVKTTHLQAINEFESGIKVQHSAAIPAERTAPTPQPTAVMVEDVLTAKSAEVPTPKSASIPSEATAPVVIAKTLPVGGEPSVAAVEAAPVPKSAPVKAAFFYPSINGKVKRNAAIEIQRILKAEKNYNGSLDGYYGPGTEKAFDAFSKNNRQWKKYQMLTDLWEVNKNAKGADTWNEIKVLKTILSEMSGGKIKPGSLVLTVQNVSKNRRKDLLKWNESLWANLTGWSKRDPMHAEIATVLRVAFFQSQVRAEEYFISKGQKPTEARFLAIAALKKMAGKDLDRFTE